MNSEEKEKAIQRYAERLRRLGPSTEALGWRNREQQQLRFDVLTSLTGVRSGESVLDLGCGFGDLYDHFVARGLEVRYTGCDLSADVLAVARERHPGLSFEARDVIASPYRSHSFDHVFISGIFNHVLIDNVGFMQRALTAAFEACTTSVCANMTTDQVDYRDKHLYYFNAENVLRFCRSLSRHVALRHDYPLYEFTVCVYRAAKSL